MERESNQWMSSKTITTRRRFARTAISSAIIEASATGFISVTLERSALKESPSFFVKPGDIEASIEAVFLSGALPVLSRRAPNSRRMLFQEE